MERFSRCDRFLRQLLCFGLYLTFSACSSGEELIGGQDIRQSVEIMIVLKNAGIAAERTKVGGADRYSIIVSRSDVDRALQLLKAYDLLPHKDQETLESVTSGNDFIPNIREIGELRLDRGLSLEIERLLAALPGVVEVRAIVRSNLVQQESSAIVSGARDEKDRSLRRASIVIRYVSPSGNQPFSTEEAQRIVANAIPGFSPEDIKITPTRVIIPMGDESSSQGIDAKGNIVQLTPLTPFPFSVPAQDKKRVIGLMGGLLVLFSISGAIIGFSMSSLFRRSKPGAPKTVRTAVLEASFKSSPGTPTVPVQRQGQLPKGGPPGA